LREIVGGRAVEKRKGKGSVKTNVFGSLKVETIVGVFVS